MLHKEDMHEIVGNIYFEESGGQCAMIAIYVWRFEFLWKNSSLVG
jgi:hypothetical protein